MYMHFSKSRQGSKWAITMRPVSKELTFIGIPFYIELSWAEQYARGALKNL